MCFSAQADLMGGVVVGALGVDAIRHVDRRQSHMMLASLPLMFAAHQLDEAFVWWSFQGRVSVAVGHYATWGYLLFAMVVLPTFVPIAVLMLEPPGSRRRRIIAPFVVLGVLVSVRLLADLLRGPIGARLGDLHVAYTGVDAGGFLVGLYVIATCGSMLFSGRRDIAWFAIVNLVAVVALARLTADGFASLWCGWAAISSGAIALHLRGEQSRQPAQHHALT